VVDRIAYREPWGRLDRVYPGEEDQPAHGREVSIAVAKVAALFLTGIAVMMIRSGIEQMMGS